MKRSVLVLIFGFLFAVSSAFAVPATDGDGWTYEDELDLIGTLSKGRGPRTLFQQIQGTKYAEGLKFTFTVFNVEPFDVVLTIKDEATGVVFYSETFSLTSSTAPKYIETNSLAPGTYSITFTNTGVNGGVVTGSFTVE